MKSGQTLRNNRVKELTCKDMEIIGCVPNYLSYPCSGMMDALIKMYAQFPGYTIDSDGIDVPPTAE